ncbi:hypothetical protein RRG08_053250 [Elysia crispata]|uniref:Uncharacterized protein n=1 Tax=Elysia crispata TaxID=231223 RepID=A0AAE1AN67_9GAST|nr:hypothetical protein RRG08_053250 [Elysia crispata]
MSILFYVKLVPVFTCWDSSFGLQFAAPYNQIRKVSTVISKRSNPHRSYEEYQTDTIQSYVNQNLILVHSSRHEIVPQRHPASPPKPRRSLPHCLLIPALRAPGKLPLSAVLTLCFQEAPRDTVFGQSLARESPQRSCLAAEIVRSGSELFPLVSSTTKLHSCGPVPEGVCLCRVSVCLCVCTSRQRPNSTAVDQYQRVCVCVFVPVVNDQTPQLWTSTRGCVSVCLYQSSTTKLHSCGPAPEGVCLCVCVSVCLYQSSTTKLHSCGPVPEGVCRVSVCLCVCVFVQSSTTKLHSCGPVPEMCVCVVCLFVCVSVCLYQPPPTKLHNKYSGSAHSDCDRCLNQYRNVPGDMALPSQSCPSINHTECPPGDHIRQTLK